jgi:Glycosyl hydrolases family 18
MSATPKLVKAWIYLNEDQPLVNGQPVGYDDPRSSYQRLITKNIYQAVDLLSLCFATTVPTSSSTIPTGNGDFYTPQMEAVDPLHPGGLTNQDYMNYVIRDSRANNPDLKITMTLDWDETESGGDQITNIFENSNYTPEENAENFASDLMAYLEHYDLDGFDCDWETPISDRTTKDQFQLLFTAIGKQFREASKKYYLSLSPADVGHLDAETVNTCFDFVALQLYSGRTHPKQFTRAGVHGDLLALGVSFESGQTAQEAYEKAQKLGYTTYSQWRLNSGNFQYEQDQQVMLYKLVFPEH